MWCVLAKITIYKEQGELAQITRNIFFLWNDKDKNEVCWHKSKLTKLKDVLPQIIRDNFFFYERTRIKTWCGQTQITINRRKVVLTQITRDIMSFIIYLGSTSAAGNDVKAGSPASPHRTRHQPHPTRSPQGSCSIESVQALAHKLKAKA